MVRTKVPDELFSEIRNPPHKLFGNQRVEGYLDDLDDAMDAELDALGRVRHLRPRSTSAGASATAWAWRRGPGRRRHRPRTSSR